MADEIELKFDVAPLELRKLKVAWARSRRPKEEKLVSVYFDTPKHKLERNGISLRVRHCGNKRLQTIKSAGAKAFLRRAEWEHEIRGDFPNLRKARGTALEPFLTRKLHRRLTPIFETRVHRTSVPVRKNRSRIEVALDEGEVRAGQRSASISEPSLSSSAAKLGTYSRWRGRWASLCQPS